MIRWKRLTRIEMKEGIRHVLHVVRTVGLPSFRQIRNVGTSD